jgi:hypothetical protein
MSASEGDYIRRETVYDTPVVAPVTPVAVVGQPIAPVVEQTVVPVAPVTRLVEPAGAVRSTYSRRFAPDAVIAALAGLALLVTGLIAVTRGGFDGPMSTPIVEVLGFTHTTTLGLIEAAIGVCLLIAGATSSRGGALFFGSVLGIGAFVGAVQEESFRESLALESGLAWLLVIAAVVVVVSALLMPRFITRSTRVQPMSM